MNIWEGVVPVRGLPQDCHAVWCYVLLPWRLLLLHYNRHVRVAWILDRMGDPRPFHDRSILAHAVGHFRSQRSDNPKGAKEGPNRAQTTENNIVFSFFLVFNVLMFFFLGVNYSQMAN